MPNENKCRGLRWAGLWTSVDFLTTTLLIIWEEVSKNPLVSHGYDEEITSDYNENTNISTYLVVALQYNLYDSFNLK